MDLEIGIGILTTCPKNLPGAESERLGWRGQCWRNVTNVLKPAGQARQVVPGNSDPFEQFECLGWDLASRLTGDLKECGGWANRYRERISRQGGERFCESGEGVKDGTQNYYQTATQCQDDGNKYGKKGTAFFHFIFLLWYHQGGSGSWKE
jgi:hypothetical protein